MFIQTGAQSSFKLWIMSHKIVKLAQFCSHTYFHYIEYVQYVKDTAVVFLHFVFFKS